MLSFFIYKNSTMGEDGLNNSLFHVAFVKKGTHIFFGAAAGIKSLHREETA